MSENIYIDEQGKIICQICKKSFWSITPQHLLKQHNIRMNEYRLKYPDSPIISDRTIEKAKIGNKENKNKTSMFQPINNVIPNNPQIDEEITDDDILQTSNNETIDIDQVEIIVEKRKNEIDELESLKKDLKDRSNKEYSDHELDPFNITHKSKLALLRSLKMAFPDLKNNYSIEKVTPTGHLEYKFITDMADPVSKIVFEFPNTFWRNIDFPPNPMKYNILKRDGWRVIIIKEVGPNIETMKKYIDFIF